jgi:hypothetical protein
MKISCIKSVDEICCCSYYIWNWHKREVRNFIILPTVICTIIWECIAPRNRNLKLDFYKHYFKKTFFGTVTKKSVIPRMFDIYTLSWNDWNYFDKVWYRCSKLKFHNYRKLPDIQCPNWDTCIPAGITCSFLFMVKTTRAHLDASRFAIHSCNAKDHRSGWEWSGNKVSSGRLSHWVHYMGKRWGLVMSIVTRSEMCWQKVLQSYFPLQMAQCCQQIVGSEFTPMEL